MLAFFFSCGSSSDNNSSPTPSPQPPQSENILLSYNFSVSTQDFEIGVAHYNVDHEENDEIVSKLSQLAEPFEYRNGIGEVNDGPILRLRKIFLEKKRSHFIFPISQPTHYIK